MVSTDKIIWINKQAPVYPELVFHILERTGKTEGERRTEMNEKIRQTLRRNRYLLLAVSVLLLGTVIGVVALQNLPKELLEKVQTLSIMGKKDFKTIWWDRFAFSECVLFGLFISGFSLFGHGTASFLLLLYGMIYGVKNAVSYHFLGSGYLIPALAEFFSFLIFTVFCFLVMGENSFYSSELLRRIIQKKNDEKPHYNGKNQAVKLICFTVILAVFSALSSYLSLVLA